jgi:hypothetical protein
MKKAPRRGLASPPRLELSGSEPSHEPQPRSIKRSKKSTPRQRATEKTRSAQTAKPGVFVEGMRKEFSAGASHGAVLQPGVPGEGEAVVAMEEPAAVATIRERPKETTATKRSSSRTAAASWRCIIRPQRWRAWVITRRRGQIFFRIPAIAPAATRGFNEVGARRCSDSARMSAGGH